jgi:hypothetical protein
MFVGGDDEKRFELHLLNDVLNHDTRSILTTLDHGSGSLEGGFRAWFAARDARSLRELYRAKEYYSAQNEQGDDYLFHGTFLHTNCGRC